MHTNPLLDFSGLPLFDRVRPEHVQPAIDTLLQQAETALQTVTAEGFHAQWDTLSRTLDTATERLGRAWNTISHLHAVVDTPEIRAAYNAVLPQVTEFYTRLGANERLYAQYKAIDPKQLSAQAAQAWRNAIRNFVLSGAELQGQAKQRYAQIQERLAVLSQKFSENALDATDAYAWYASADEVQGLPDDVLQSAAQAAQADQKDGYKITLKQPCYLPVMQFAHHRALRERLYSAYVTRASELGEAKLDNSTLMQEIVQLRQEEAALLGYPSFADLSLVPKMAGSPQQVVEFLHTLATKARPFAEQDVRDMREFAQTELALPDPQAWDWPYIAEKLKESRYAFSEQEVKQYFTAPRVLAGLFSIIETLFDVRIQPDQAPVWHPDVQFYRLERHGQLVGQFYLDQPARTGKRSGAWMDDVRSRWLRPDTGQTQTPVAHLICNFAQGVKGQPALLTHDDVITLFHEFGHGLHHMLTQVTERDIAGINGVEWDAVELPSQFMENFCWEWDVLQGMTAHVETGQPLPRALFDKMLAAKNFQSGLQTMRQVEYALFDMLIHAQHSTPVEDVMALLKQVRQEVGVLPAPSFSRPMHTFSHIFSGGYAAGYYSYKWAEVLSADVYAAFEEARDKHPERPHRDTLAEVGQHLLRTIFETGGSRPAMESFIAFRGRQPDLNALLRHQGM